MKAETTLSSKLHFYDPPQKKVQECRQDQSTNCSTHLTLLVAPSTTNGDLPDPTRSRECKLFRHKALNMSMFITRKEEAESVKLGIQDISFLKSILELNFRHT